MWKGESERKQAKRKRIRTERKMYTLNINVQNSAIKKARVRSSVIRMKLCDYVLQITASFGLFCANNIMLIDLMLNQFLHFNPSTTFAFYDLL